METKEQIFDAVAERLSPSASGGSGFVEHPKRQGDLYYIFANRDSYPRGHMLDEDSEPVPLPKSAIHGQIIGLAFGVRKSQQYEDSPKLRLDLNADGDRFIIEMGYNTNTARGVIAALDNDEDATVETLERGITIAFEPEEEHDKVLYANVYDAGGEAIIGQANQLRSEDGKAMANAVDRVNNKIQQLSTARPVGENWLNNDSQQQSRQQQQSQQQSGNTPSGTPSPQSQGQEPMPTNTMPTG